MLLKYLKRHLCFHSVSPGVTGCSWMTFVFSFRVARCNRVFVEDLCFHSASPGVTGCSWMTCVFQSASPGVTGCS